MLPPSHANTRDRPIQLRSPLSTIDVNQGQVGYRINGPTDEQWRKVEALVFMGSELITSAMACVDVLFTEGELANGNTSGSNGYQQLSEEKLNFLSSTLRQKHESPVFQEQWETVRT